MYSAGEICRLLPEIHIPNNNIWCYSGFTIEEILLDDEKKKLLNKCSVLIDGPFEVDKRDVTLLFRGSSNQRMFRKNGEGIFVEVPN